MNRVIGLPADNARTFSTDQAILNRRTTLKNYSVSAWFAGGGSARGKLRLVDGTDPAGNELVSRIVMDTTGIEQTDWALGSVVGKPTQEFMTIVWELMASGLAASHADGFDMESPCNAPFADTDEDGDVDQEDFALFQICYTGPDEVLSPGSPEYCSCLDAVGLDGRIDQTDLAVFEGCASGPGIPADPNCGS